MKIAVQENLLPGETLTEKFDFAEELGIEGVEVQGRSRLYDRVEEYEAALAGRSLVISTICGQLTFDWLDPDPAKRRASIAETKRNLDAGGQFNAVGAIVPPIFGPPRIPDLSPWMVDEIRGRPAVRATDEFHREVGLSAGPYVRGAGLVAAGDARVAQPPGCVTLSTDCP
jgi:sugar phosphate isomerase/epimerase